MSHGCGWGGPTASGGGQALHTLNTGPRARDFILTTEGRFLNILGLQLHIGARRWRGPNRRWSRLEWLVRFQQQGAELVEPWGHGGAAPHRGARTRGPSNRS